MLLVKPRCGMWTTSNALLKCLIANPFVERLLLQHILKVWSIPLHLLTIVVTLLPNGMLVFVSSTNTIQSLYKAVIVTIIFALIVRVHDAQCSLAYICLHSEWLTTSSFRNKTPTATLHNTENVFDEQKCWFKDVFRLSFQIYIKGPLEQPGIIKWCMYRLPCHHNHHHHHHHHHRHCFLPAAMRNLFQWKLTRRLRDATWLARVKSRHARADVSCKSRKFDKFI
jgi:hypothetical protein